MKKVLKFVGEMVGIPSAPQSGAVVFPYDLKETFGKKSVKAKITYDGILYRGLMKSMGGDCVYCLIRKDIRAQLGKNPGDVVSVTVEEDTEERIIEVPSDFQKLLNANTKAKAFFENLAFTGRKEYVVWIASAKREETRLKRLQKSIELLLAGKKTPN